MGFIKCIGGVITKVPLFDLVHFIKPRCGVMVAQEPPNLLVGVRFSPPGPQVPALSSAG